jgi:hypothetical protein
VRPDQDGDEDGTPCGLQIAGLLGVGTLRTGGR